jgi:NAD(P)-dependent dehydrogenase (short-subunit alcohol dehydrogenase family)
MGLLEAHAALAGRKAVVLGGAFGVGRAVTLALAKAKVELVICDVDQAALAEIGPEVEALGGRMLAMEADVCDVAALNAFYDTAEATLGTLDFCINLAGGVKRQNFMDTTPEQNAYEIRRNYGYVLDSVRRAVPLIRKGGRGGSIVNFTTIEAHRGAATFAVYAGAKAATTNFTRAVAVELAAEGIRVNTLAPDATPSRGSLSTLSPDVLEKFAQLKPEIAAKGLEIYVPQKTPPSQEQLADGVLILVSDLSRGITGITLHVDGGTSASLGFIDWPHGDGFMPAPMGGSSGRLFS